MDIQADQPPKQGRRGTQSPWQRGEAGVEEYGPQQVYVWGVTPLSHPAVAVDWLRRLATVLGLPLSAALQEPGFRGRQRTRPAAHLVVVIVAVEEGLLPKDHAGQHAA